MLVGTPFLLSLKAITIWGVRGLARISFFFFFREEEILGEVWGGGSLGKQSPPRNRVPLAPPLGGENVGGTLLPSSAAVGADLPRASGGAGAAAVLPPARGGGRGRGRLSLTACKALPGC